MKNSWPRTPNLTVQQIAVTQIDLARKGLNKLTYRNQTPEANSF